MTKPKPPAAAPKSRTLNVVAEPGKSREALIAEVATGASVPAAMVISDFSKGQFGEVSLSDVLASLKKHAGKIKNGDLARVETMLCGQATALNTIFAELARRGALNMGEYTGAAEIYLKLALRAQNQCRATLETLAVIKNPPTIFAKQANIAHGPQQVNNEPTSIAHAKQIEKPQTELLEHEHGERLDRGATSTTGCGDKAMATLGTVHRPANDRWKGQS